MNFSFTSHCPRLLLQCKWHCQCILAWEFKHLLSVIILSFSSLFFLLLRHQNVTIVCVWMLRYTRCVGVYSVSFNSISIYLHFSINTCPSLSHLVLSQMALCLIQAYPLAFTQSCLVHVIFQLYIF